MRKRWYGARIAAPAAELRSPFGVHASPLARWPGPPPPPRERRAPLAAAHSPAEGDTAPADGTAFDAAAEQGGESTPASPSANAVQEIAGDGGT